MKCGEVWWRAEVWGGEERGKGPSTVDVNGEECSEVN